MEHGAAVARAVGASPNPNHQAGNRVWPEATGEGGENRVRPKFGVGAGPDEGSRGAGLDAGLFLCWPHQVWVGAVAPAPKQWG